MVGVAPGLLLVTCPAGVSGRRCANVARWAGGEWRASRGLWDVGCGPWAVGRGPEGRAWMVSLMEAVAMVKAFVI